MSKSIYCVGKIKGNDRKLMVAEDSNNNVPAKRINKISIKMVTEATML